MEIIHRISFNGNKYPEFFSEISRIGIDFENTSFPGHGIGLVTFEISESDSKWESIWRLVEKCDVAEIIRTDFTTEEIINAEWNRMIVNYEWGYPQPEASMKWIEATYDNSCRTCGLIGKQINPFLLKKDPRLGKNDFFLLTWTIENFCTHKVIEVLHREGITGFENRDPIIKPINGPSKLVTQLIFPEVTKPGLGEEDKKGEEICPECGTVKYLYHRRGKMHIKRDTLNNDVDFQLLYDWFGSDSHNAFREILVSNRLTQLILREGWRGVQLKPVELI